MIGWLLTKFRDRVDPAWKPTGTRLTQPGGYSFDHFVAKRNEAQARETKRRQLAASGAGSTQPRVEHFRRVR